MSEESKPKKTAVRKVAAKATTAAAPKKRAAKTAAPEVEATPVAEVVVEAPVQQAPTKVAATGTIAAGRYLPATGRRKTAVANVRLFAGQGEIVVNKKPFKVYFSNSTLQNEALLAFKLTGLGGQYYFVATVAGGGIQAQAQAVRHGISKALSTLGDEVKRVLKKNGLLTRDDRKKERKKPGLRRARRAPQWAKR
ncbi:MAG: 30S ribosomal protein S9 [Candidatus Doudnabacteria bacterium]|nr:30S ribosomal protein S9 [Candidatus Doudnabacteria bacterium]